MVDMIEGIEETEGHPYLYVHMLGGFSMNFGAKPLSMACNMNSKGMQLLLILLYNGRRGISRGRLLEMLYGNEDLSNPSNSLRATVFRLRKLLTAAGLPDNDYIKNSGGMYYWNSEKVETFLDAEEFEKMAEKALAADKKGGQLALLKKACNLYRGEFLPMLAAEEWVAVASVHYQELYFSCLREACSQMKEQREYEDMLELCTIATNIYPFEEWQIMQIDCLMALNRYKEALKAYEHATSMFFEELGLSPSEKMLARFRAMSGQIYYATGAITDIKNSLREKEWVPGAYYCNYPSFIDSYRLIVRMIERSGQSVYLMLCTLTDAKGTPLDSKDEILNRAAEHLHGAVGRALRRGDVYTRYSPNQYLVLMMGLTYESCSIIADRIDKKFAEEYSSRKVGIRYYVTTVAEMESEESQVQFGTGGPQWEKQGR